MVVTPGFGPGNEGSSPSPANFSENYFSDFCFVINFKKYIK